MEEFEYNEKDFLGSLGQDMGKCAICFESF